MAVKLDRLFKEPRRTERPLRILVYGLPKRGKSHFVFTGARVGPLYWIDTEGGSDYYSPTEGHGFRVLRSIDPRHAIQAVEAASASVNGGLRPVVAVDSFSSVWFSQQEVAEELTYQWSKGRGGDRASFRAWGPAKKPLKQLYNLMMATRCHVIVTARAKEKYEVSKLPATAEGETPEDVVSTVDVQVHNALVAPSTWRELKAILEGKNWDIDKAKELLQQKFGAFNAAKVVEYWEYLMAHQEPHAAS
jgi:hypothetical protein